VRGRIEFSGIPKMYSTPKAESYSTFFSPTRGIPVFNSIGPKGSNADLGAEHIGQTHLRGNSLNLTPSFSSS